MYIYTCVCSFYIDLSNLNMYLDIPSMFTFEYFSVYMAFAGFIGSLVIMFITLYPPALENIFKYIKLEIMRW